MALKMFGLVGLLTLSCSAMAISQEEVEARFYSIESMEVEEIQTDVLNQTVSKTITTKYFDRLNQIQDAGGADVGSVIQMGRDLVALGEEVYTLVQKGKPNVKTDYAPISVIPKEGSNPVDLMDTEGWKMPIKKSYRVTFKNFYQINVVDFTYGVLFTYGGSYNGRGAYLTATQVIPESVHVLFGFDFTATMKLTGIQNQGTRENPVAAAILGLNYTINSVMTAIHKDESWVVTGRGAFKKL